jgi:hypothetical protein
MRRRFRVLVSIAGGLAAAGCAAKAPPFDQDAMRASKPRTLVVAADRSPAMTAEGPAKEGLEPLHMYGLVGAMAAWSRAEGANRKRTHWMKGCGIDDPVDDIRDAVAEALARTLSLQVLASDRRTQAKDTEGVILDYPGADLIVDIRTARWGIHRINVPSKNGLVHFAAGYDGSLRLIDARKRAVVAEATCSVQFSNGDDPPTIRELLEDDCALLDKGLMLSAQTCARRLREALGLE